MRLSLKFLLSAPRARTTVIEEVSLKKLVCLVRQNSIVRFAHSTCKGSREGGGKLTKLIGLAILLGNYLVFQYDYDVVHRNVISFLLTTCVPCSSLLRENYKF